MFRLSLTGNNQDIRVLLIRFLIVLAVLSVPAAWISFGFTTVNMWLHKKRWWIGLGIVGAAVLLDVNGSSLGMWNFWLGRDMSEDIILGTPRPIRTDEYIVGTPLAFSQEYSNYAFFNTIVGGTPTNMSIIKDSPVWFITELLKPFHWGYFLFGSSRGLAFYWSARIIALFLCAYEFMLIVTKDSQVRYGNKRFALISAALIAFAPLVQWWFAVNNLPEMLIAMFIAWISLDNLLKKHGAWERFGFILIIAWAACSFIITLYPAWQIPLVYLILVVSIWIISQHWGSIHFTGRNYLSVGVAIVFFIIIFLIGLFISWADIYATLNTVYPGARHEVGGGVQIRIVFFRICFTSSNV